LILILDFESIVAEISPDIGIKLSEVEALGERAQNTSPILFAEDSKLLSMLIYDGLTKAGYTNVIPTNNGLELWNLLQQYKKAGTLKKNVSCVVTDIEMPQMDGHRLLKLMKEDSELREIPVIIFSSLINEEMRRKGEQLGADAQLSKNEMGEFIKSLDNILREKV
jgi:two-component system chemotaxis response regulator CheV